VSEPLPTTSAWRSTTDRLNPWWTGVALGLVTVLVNWLVRDTQHFARWPGLLTATVVLVAVTLGGFVPGAISSVMGVSALEYFRREVSGERSILHTGEQLRVALLLLLLMCVSLIGEALQRERRRLATSVRELTRSEERYRTLLEQASDAILVAQPPGRFVIVNQRACEMLGYTREELLSLSLTDVISPESVASQPIRWKELETKPLILGEREMVRKDRSRFMVEVTARQLKDGRSQAIARDITDRLREAQERRRLEQQLQHSQRLEAVGRLAGGVAHDFNNLLTVIIGSAEIALAKPGPEPVFERMKEILGAAQRGSGLTRQLLAFSRKQETRPAILDVNGVVANFEKMLRRLAGDNVAVVTEFDPNAGCVLADVTQLEQVLMNLAINARDAMPAGGTMRITTRGLTAEPDPGAGTPAGAHQTAIAVSDTGTGMDPETQAQMFEPFFTTKSEGEGTGLGLSTVYGIVQQNHGRIRVASASGKGTTVEIVLPSTAPRGEVAPRPAAPAGTRQQASRILLVEDEDEVREITRLILEHEGFAVFEANGGQEALAAAESFGVVAPLLVTDMVMPGLSGRALADVLARRWPSLRVLYLSGYVHHDLGEAALSVPGRAFLPKPFTSDQLIAAVQSLMHARGAAPR
jgi:two-component system cell cycle sensor histidine kinase/response regulator CckA